MTVLSPPLEQVRDEVSARRRSKAAIRSWLSRHALSLALLLPVLAIAAAVHLVGSENYPRYVDDPGTYLSQAWSLRYEGSLSPYSYFYDHAPAGWAQIALWAALTNGFDRYSSAIQFGTECMLIAKLAATALIYALSLRLRLARPTAVLAALLFALSPLAVVYGRWTYLDNLVVPWLLAAFVLAYSPRRSIAAMTGAAASFAMAALTKETALVLLPAFAWAMAQNLDRRNRAQVLAVSLFTGGLLMSMYPLLALYKGELFPGPGHNSLLGTAMWQLSGRASTGSLLDQNSATRDLVEQWLAIDPYLLAAGLAALPVAVFVRRLRPAALALAIGWLMLLRDGYVPFMHVIGLLPFSALLAAAALDVVVTRHAGKRRLAVVSAVTAVAMVAAIAVWASPLRQITGPHPRQPLRAATLWAADNIPRDKVLVVHDTIWTDLVHHYGFQPRPIIVHKLDSDPAVAEKIHRLDYLIVPNWYYGSQDASAYPTLLEARKHAVPVAVFGEGDDGVKVYRVSDFWSPS